MRGLAKLIGFTIKLFIFISFIPFDYYLNRDIFASPNVCLFFNGIEVSSREHGLDCHYFCAKFCLAIVTL